MTEGVKRWSHIFTGEKSDITELSLLHSNLIIHGDNVDSARTPKSLGYVEFVNTRHGCEILAVKVRVGLGAGSQ